ncbi:MAG: ABC transporter ATP-binding protein [Proteobacteria bacterium]|nr:ABC transporter ATP-binding protein [Pseudomonadota bacterium]MBU1449583.1 ABC transporter ATP-binding protein [Pseudomonadota bacterium]MBU2468364.1 ABC transporter ATP-binding protein [Pseudomonadota bacterium]MBU2516880.1 ABC transporter ATP-binding protein [Pseudomonadota bacterium]
MPDILVVKSLEKYFGHLLVVSQLSFEVRQGEILGVLGPNGAGKTTMFNLITGTLKADGGSIIFNGVDITRESPARRCRQGIGRTYQIPRPFENMTVYENLLVGAVHGAGMREKHAAPFAMEVLELIRLLPEKDKLAGGLCLLDRKRLELGRALATQPRLLLIDEVAGGLTENEVEMLLKVVKEIQHRGVSIVWIEHILMMLSEGVDRLLVLDGGRRLQCGDPRHVMNSQDVMECYLGSEED